MTTATKIEIEFNEMKSEHTFYSDEGNKDLVVVFPGGNNSCNRPIIHYLRKYFLDQNYDVLYINYENIVNKEDPPAKKRSQLIFAINKAIKSINKDDHYDKKIFISRSFGNIISCELKIKYSIKIHKSIYISPITEAMKYINDYPGFIVTSSDDEYLTKDEIDYLKSIESNKVLIFKDGTHGLESSNVIETIEFHKLVIKNIVDFVEINLSNKYKIKS